MDNASLNGHQDVLDWWKTSEVKMKWSTWAMGSVSRHSQAALEYIFRKCFL